MLWSRSAARCVCRTVSASAARPGETETEGGTLRKNELIEGVLALLLAFAMISSWAEGDAGSSEVTCAQTWNSPVPAPHCFVHPFTQLFPATAGALTLQPFT